MIVAVTLFLGMIGILTFAGWYKRRSEAAKVKREDEEIAEPRLGKIVMCRIRCPICQGPLTDGDLVFWHEKKSGHKTDSVHASCGVVIKGEDGCLRTLTGEYVSWLPYKVPPIRAIVTQEMWETWKREAGA